MVRSGGPFDMRAMYLEYLLEYVAKYPSGAKGWREEYEGAFFEEELAARYRQMLDALIEAVGIPEVKAICKGRG